LNARLAERPKLSLLGLSSLAAALTFLALFLAAAPPADATTAEFCSNAYLAPYGSGGDNCAGGGYHRNDLVQVQAFEHSACASSTTDGSKSGVNVAWVCTAGGGGAVVQNYVNSSVYTYGIIRNNTTGAGNHATGVVDYQLP
jgi:hypothetical protein